MGGGVSIVFWVFFSIIFVIDESSQCLSLQSCQVAPFLVLWLERAGFCQSLSSFIGVSCLPASSFSSLGYVRQEENPGTSRPCCTTGPEVQVPSLSVCLTTFWSLFIFVFYIMFRVFLGGVQKSMSTLFYQKWKSSPFCMSLMISLRILSKTRCHLFAHSKESRKKIPTFEIIRIFCNTCFICGYSTSWYSYRPISCHEF